MATNPNPFKPRDPQGRVAKSLAVATLAAVGLGAASTGFGLNPYTTFGIALVGFFGTAYAVWQRLEP